MVAQQATDVAERSGAMYSYALKNLGRPSPDSVNLLPTGATLFAAAT